MDITKYCTKCKRDKPLNYFHKDKLTKDGYTHICGECRNANSRKYNTENKIWLNESVKQNRRISEAKRRQRPEVKQQAVHASTKWQRDNPGKSIPYNRANASMKRMKEKYPELLSCTIADVLPIYIESYNKEVETGVKHHVDHIIPLVAGGIHHPSNLKVLTEEEHKEKSLKEFRLMRELMYEYYHNNKETKDEF